MDRPNVHHDALEFPSGQIVLVTRLCEGQRATVLQLPASPRVTREAQGLPKPIEQCQLRGKRVWIHLALGEFRQANVGLLFLFKALMQHLLIIAQVELASQSRSGAIIPNPIDQNPWAHWRSPMDMMRQGWSTSLFHAAQQWSTRSS